MTNEERTAMTKLIEEMWLAWERIMEREEKEEAFLEGVIEDLLASPSPEELEEASSLFTPTEQERFILNSLKDRYDMVEVLDLLREGVKFQRKMWQDKGRGDIHIYYDEEQNMIYYKTDVLHTPYICESEDLLAADWIIYEE